MESATLIRHGGNVLVGVAGPRRAAQGLICGTELVEDVDTVPPVVDHAGDAAHLSFDPRESQERDCGTRQLRSPLRSFSVAWTGGLGLSTGRAPARAAGVGQDRSVAFTRPDRAPLIRVMSDGSIKVALRQE